MVKNAFKKIVDTLHNCDGCEVATEEGLYCFVKYKGLPLKSTCKPRRLSK